MIDQRIPQVLSLIQGGAPMYDASLTSRTANIVNEISTLQATLTNAGQSGLAAQLDGIDFTPVESLSSYVSSNLSGLISRMGTFGDLAQVSGTSPDPGAAFGSLLHSRTILSAIDGISSYFTTNTTPDLDDINDRLTYLQGIPAQVSTITSNEDAFYSSANSTISQSLQAASIVGTFNQGPQMQVVMGAVADPGMLSILQQPASPQDAPDP
jgi:predicted PurR-regulated permease PerM